MKELLLEVLLFIFNVLFLNLQELQFLLQLLKTQQGDVQKQKKKNQKNIAVAPMDIRGKKVVFFFFSHIMFLAH